MVIEKFICPSPNYCNLLHSSLHGILKYDKASKLIIQIPNPVEVFDLHISRK